MATFRYDKAGEGFANADIDWLADDIKVALVTNGYSPNKATDEFYSLVGANEIVVSGNLATKTSALGVMDADDITFAAVPTSQNVEAMIYYQDTGNTATSRLIAYVDNATGLPLVTNGGDINVTWDSGVSKILAI